MNCSFGSKTSGFLIAIVCSASAFAGQAFCNGYATSSAGSTVFGNCTGGYCTASLPTDFLTVSGNCDNGQQFQAQGFSSGGEFQATCENGSIFSQLPSSSVSLNGRCGMNGTFEGNAQAELGNYLQGTCSDDGSFTASMPILNYSVSGSCFTAN